MGQLRAGNVAVMSESATRVVSSITDARDVLPTLTWMDSRRFVFAFCGFPMAYSLEKQAWLTARFKTKALRLAEVLTRASHYDAVAAAATRAFYEDMTINREFGRPAVSHVYGVVDFVNQGEVLLDNPHTAELAKYAHSYDAALSRWEPTTMFKQQREEAMHVEMLSSKFRLSSACIIGLHVFVVALNATRYGDSVSYAVFAVFFAHVVELAVRVSTMRWSAFWHNQSFDRPSAVHHPEPFRVAANRFDLVLVSGSMLLLLCSTAAYRRFRLEPASDLIRFATALPVFRIFRCVLQRPGGVVAVA
jgi:hypothetical protein